MNSLSQYLAAPADLEPEPYSVAFVEALSHGVAVGIYLPDSPDPVPAEVLDQLHPAEREAAAGMRAYRQVSYTGGRLAIQVAMEQLGGPLESVGSGPRGEPLLPGGLAGSITHKRTLAVALVAREAHGALGIDLEDLHPARDGIAERVLRPEELEAIAHLPSDRRWTATAVRFSIKEAVYKAVHPFVNRYVGFEEASCQLDVDGTARVDLLLNEESRQFRVEARYYWLPGQVLSTVRIRQFRRRR
jgi:enterobactin synthetase component D